MRIIFERTGGFMGRKVSLDVHLKDLPTPQAESLQQLIDQSDFLELKDSVPDSDSARDGFQYRITVEAEIIHHSVETTEFTMPAKLRPLIDELTRLARTMRSSGQ
jgi:hypothetical protein